MNIYKYLLLIAIIASQVSCSPRMSSFAKQELAEMQNCTGNSIHFKLKEVIIPYVIDGDFGIPEHGESLWLGAFVKNESFNKEKLIQLIDSLNANCNIRHSKFRLPTDIEKSRYKLDQRIITEEQFILLKKEEQINSNALLIVKVCLGETSGDEF